jgi:hypothetical protein
MMLDEYGCDYDWTPEPRQVMTAVLSHPGHGRLVEKVLLVLSSIICYKDCFYSLSWRAGDVAYYQPVYLEPEPAACGCAH